MEFLCPSEDLNTVNEGLQGYNVTVNRTIEVTLDDSTFRGVNTTSSEAPHDIHWNYGDFTRRFAVPSLCVFGMIGNVLNIMILSKRIREGKIIQLIRI